MIQDLRYAIRMLFRNPGFTLIVVAILGLGIGVNATIFSMANGILLKPLPAEDPTDLIRLHVTGDEGTSLRMSYPDYADVRDQNDVFTGLTAIHQSGMGIRLDAAEKQVLGEMVSGNFFSVLGITPQSGRVFSSAEDSAGAERVAVISHTLWENFFHHDPNTIGSTIYLNGSAFSVIGILPQKFTGTIAGVLVDIWIPLLQSSEWPGSGWRTNRDQASVFVIGRLKQEVDREEAGAAMRIQSDQLALAYPETNEGRRIEIVPATMLQGNLRRAVSGFMAIVIALVALVLLVACGNLANLLLARATGRRREIAMRLALGASRWRIIRQLLVESVLLGMLGGVTGLLAAMWTSMLLSNFNPIPFVPLRFDFSPDYRVLIYGLFLSLITGILLGLVPALHVAKTKLGSVLKDEAGSLIGGIQKSKLRNAFLILQMGLSMVLLLGATLFLQSLQNSQKVDPGFEVKNGFAMDFSSPKEDAMSSAPFFEELLERVRQFPGVQNAALSDLAPLDLATAKTGVVIERHLPEPGQSSIPVSVNRISPGYFQTMGIAILQGRDFSRLDNQTSRGVVIMNQTMAESYWPGKNPIGMHFTLEDNESENVLGMEVEIVALVKDVKYRTLGETATPHMYLPYQQHDRSGLTLLARTAGNTKEMIGNVQRDLKRWRPETQGFFSRTFEEHTAFALLPFRLAAILTGIFGLIALILSAVGVYGSISYSLAQRTREIGIRMALGARPENIVSFILAEGARIALIGIAIGIGVSLALSRLLSGLLLGVSTTDPLTFLAVSFFLFSVAVVACYVPGRRAAAVEPVEALRSV